jgi:hypothetical protein
MLWLEAVNAVSSAKSSENRVGRTAVKEGLLRGRIE